MKLILYGPGVRLTSYSSPEQILSEMKTCLFHFEYKLLQSLNLYANVSNRLSHIPSAQEVKPKVKVREKMLHRRSIEKMNMVK